MISQAESATQAYMLFQSGTLAGIEHALSDTGALYGQLEDFRSGLAAYLEAMNAASEDRKDAVVAKIQDFMTGVGDYLEAYDANDWARANAMIAAAGTGSGDSASIVNKLEEVRKGLSDYWITNNGYDNTRSNSIVAAVNAVKAVGDTIASRISTGNDRLYTANTWHETIGGRLMYGGYTASGILYAISGLLSSGGYSEAYYSSLIRLNAKALNVKLGATGYALGGIATGPTSGYPVTLHGTEAVIPLPSGGKIPVENIGGGGLSDPEIKALLQQLVVQGAQKQQVKLELDNGQTLTGYLSAVADNVRVAGASRSRMATRKGYFN
jgi:hypothetical protein